MRGRPGGRPSASDRRLRPHFSPGPATHGQLPADKLRRPLCFNRVARVMRTSSSGSKFYRRVYFGRTHPGCSSAPAPCRRRPHLGRSTPSNPEGPARGLGGRAAFPGPRAFPPSDNYFTGPFSSKPAVAFPSPSSDVAEGISSLRGALSSACPHIYKPSLTCSHFLPPSRSGG